MKTLTKIAIGLVALGAAGAAIVQVGRSAGDYAMERSLPLVAKVWSDPLSLPVDDRATVARTSLACELFTLPPESSDAAVVACLRDGARKLDARGEDAVAPRLERMLVQWQERTQAIGVTTN